MTVLQRISGRLVATSNITLSGTGQVIDTATVAANDEILAVGQTDQTQNGLWIAAAGAWTQRAPEFDTAAEMLVGTEFHIREGSSDNAGSKWEFRTTGTITVGTTALSFVRTGWGSGATKAGAGLEENPKGTIRVPDQWRIGTGKAWPFVLVDSRGIVWDGLNDTIETLIRGFLLAKASGQQITCGDGEVFVQGIDDIAIESALDTLSLPATANTWFYFYARRYSGYQSETVFSTTAPGAPYRGTAASMSGDTSQRYVGAVRTNSSGVPFNFQWEGDGSSPFVRYLEGTGVAPFAVLSGGTATTRTTVSCSAVVPPTSRKAWVWINNTGSTTVDFSYPGVTSNAIQTNAANKDAYGWLDLDASQQFDYQFRSAPTGSLNVYVLGYLDRR